MYKKPEKTQHLVFALYSP